MKTLFIIIPFLFLTNSNLIHQDTPLKIDKSGNIVGLPKEFGQSKFDKEKYYLKIKDMEILFPECLIDYFNIHEKPELNLSASWYHSKDLLPYYLNFEISQKDENYAYIILIDLETLELIEVQISIQQGNTTYFHDIKFTEYCLKEYEESIQCIE